MNPLKATSTENVCVLNAGDDPSVAEKAVSLGISISKTGDGFEFGLSHDEEGWCLRDLSRSSLGPLRIDFLGGISQTRQRTSRSKNPLIQALGGLPTKPLHVFDATAGLGRDLMDLLTAGFVVTACEESPVLFALLEDGISRLRGLAEYEQPLRRLQLIRGESIQEMRSRSTDTSPSNFQKSPFDLIYLDPMYPHKESSASPKKEMQYLRRLLGPTPNIEEMLIAAISAVKYRVVVKRPHDVGPLGKPTHSYQTKLVRFDMYSKCPIP